MSYKVEYTSKAKKDLKKLPLEIAQSIIRSINTIKDDLFLNIILYQNIFHVEDFRISGFYLESVESRSNALSVGGFNAEGLVGHNESSQQRPPRLMVESCRLTAGRFRKKDKVPPFLLVVEEAHNFAPEKVERQYALAKGPIITIAREGRKFGACLCLISQRPVQLATTALSQCNTNIILRITNPFDIKHVGESCEGIDSAMLDSITTLRVGEALVVGEAAGSPIFVKVRKRKSSFFAKGRDLEIIARRFEEEKTKKRQDVEAFL